MSNYTSVHIIFNPNSTGNGKQLAEDLKKRLAKKGYAKTATLSPTKHAGHAETMAYDLAKASKRPLVISASGDGGYNEVINGLVRAQKEGAKPVAGLLPAGNANDHYNNLHEEDMVKSIIKQNEQTIDLLKIDFISEGKPQTRYAHSYIGIGLTPKVGQELNQTQLNWFNEILIVLRVLFFLQPVRIAESGKIRNYDSLIFSNINKMSKVLKLAKDASPDDGKFEKTAFLRRNKLRLISMLIRSSTTGLVGGQKLREYKFKTIKQVLVQFDGEIGLIDAETDVKITLEPGALRCIV